MIIIICSGVCLLALTGVCACAAAMQSSRFTRDLAEIGQLPQDFVE